MARSYLAPTVALSLLLALGIGLTATHAAQLPDQASPEASERFEQRFKHRRHHRAMKEAREAVANNDYETWADVMSKHPLADSFVNEETFSRLREAYALHETGDKEGARAILKELRDQLPRPEHRAPQPQA